MNKKLYRSERNRKIGGVCGGLAEYLGIDATIIRLIWAICIFVYGGGLLIYLICWLIIPKESELA
ncbi:MAG TPA: PspC domain-containing protein [Clostridia bacterium]|jgi:phage shock protein C|nr:PspC domain-containing protein [Clostridia bacterium]